MKNSVILILATYLIGTWAAYAQDKITYRAEAAAHAATGTFAPYYMTANKYGTVANGCGGSLRAGAFIKMDTTQRFSYAAGVELMGIYETPSPTRRWENGNFTTLYNRPQIFRIQQLYADVKYRAIFHSVGMREREDENIITNHRLSSGNLILSGIARPIPQVRV